jgi:3-hydroxybutyryl-CoA dehydrogenase
MDIKKVGVVGAGTMGSGIAQVFAQSGFSVVLVDVSDSILGRAIASIGGSMDRMIKKEKMTAADKDAALKRITKTTSLKDLGDCEIIIEAVIEDFETKKKTFEELDRVAKACAILASNTSSISITKLAACTKRAGDVIGMHFMNPVPMMALAEIVRGAATSDEVYGTTEALAKSVGKTPVEVNDYPGFVSNRVLMPMINEACYTLMEGVATKEAIDTVMKLGMAHPMGPLQLADLIGLDICLSIMEVLYEGFSDSKYRPCPLLKKMVAAGYLGRKTKKGFYTYE